MFSERYLRNKILNEKQQKFLKESSVVVFGLGGLGGFVVEGLARMGVGKLVIIDIDVFSESNLNRQRFSNECNIGKSKVNETKLEINKINSEVEIIAIEKLLTRVEIIKLIDDEKIDLIIDCLDTKKDKIMLEQICEVKNKILIHGGISGWVGEVATIYPGDKLLQNFYEGKKDGEDIFGNPSFTPMFIGAFQVSEAIKALINENMEHNKLYCIDLKNNECQVLENW